MKKKAKGQMKCAKIFLLFCLCFWTICYPLEIYIDISYDWQGEFYGSNISEGLTWFVVSLIFGVISIKIYKRL